MEPGESWAYRARGIDPLVEVRVLRHGTQRPARVLIKFVDDEFEGREEWVPPARLKVLWSEVEEFRAREERWERMVAHGPDDESLTDAASIIFDRFIGADLASIAYRGGEAIAIEQPNVLAARLGLRVEQLTDHPDAFVEDGTVIAPWRITELVARTAAEKNAEQILRYVNTEERKAQREAIYGRTYSRGRGEVGHFSAEDSAELDQQYNKPVREILRSWCGVETVGRFDELAELRKEIKRVGDVAQSAIDALRSAGHSSRASQLERELGTPVEILRTEEADQ